MHHELKAPVVARLLQPTWSPRSCTEVDEEVNERAGRWNYGELEKFRKVAPQTVNCNTNRPIAGVETQIVQVDGQFREIVELLAQSSPPIVTNGPSIASVMFC